MSDIKEAVVTIEHTRPRATTHVPGKCFYCPARLGQPHGPKCVVPQRTVRMRWVLEYDADVPANWDKRQIEFHRNMGTWCADNAVDELKKTTGDDGCLCSMGRFEVVDEKEKKQ